jgi:hypothetical protein
MEKSSELILTQIKLNKETPQSNQNNQFDSNGINTNISSPSEHNINNQYMSPDVNKNK